jgi:uncharacterized protein (TIGR03435 family)
MRRRVSLITVVVASAAIGALTAPQVHGQVAQSEDQKALVFEVASIKRNAGVDPQQASRILPGGRVEATNMPLRSLIRAAYDTTAAQIIGGPSWLASDGYDIVAKAPADVLLEGPRGMSPQLQAMLKNLLEDRFQLRVHSETRETQAYALLLATDGGRRGPELKVSVAHCNVPNVCGIRGGNGDVNYTGVKLAQITASLAGFAAVRAPVIDRTALMDRYDLHLRFNDDTGPNLFTALREQAGLKLQPETTQMQFIVVDRAERPTQD